jgi:hypothetical protein
MPTKFKSSVVNTSKNSNGTVARKTQHFYMSGTSTKELLETYQKSNTTPKYKDKIRKELVKRGVEV